MNGPLLLVMLKHQYKHILQQYCWQNKIQCVAGWYKNRFIYSCINLLWQDVIGWAALCWSYQIKNNPWKHYEGHHDRLIDNFDDHHRHQKMKDPFIWSMIIHHIMAQGIIAGRCFHNHIKTFEKCTWLFQPWIDLWEEKSWLSLSLTLWGQISRTGVI